MLETVLADQSKTHKNFRGVLPRASILALLCAGLETFPTTTGAQEGTFVPTGSLATPGVATATLLNDGTVLITNGSTTSAELYHPAPGTFTATGSMPTASYFTATLLNNGVVLLAGGFGGTGTSAELYHPATGTFTATGSMTTFRSNPTATLLNNGKVLFAGGGPCTAQTACSVASAELYDPATGTFSLTGSMSSGRDGATATRLNNGKVLIAGGEQAFTNPLASAELYDPATGTFGLTSNMSTTRINHTATILNNGKVLVAGGIDPTTGARASAELRPHNGDLHAYREHEHRPRRCHGDAAHQWNGLDCGRQ